MSQDRLILFWGIIGSVRFLQYPKSSRHQLDMSGSALSLIWSYLPFSLDLNISSTFLLVFPAFSQWPGESILSSCPISNVSASYISSSLKNIYKFCWVWTAFPPTAATLTQTTTTFQQLLTDPPVSPHSQLSILSTDLLSPIYSSKTLVRPLPVKKHPTI